MNFLSFLASILQDTSDGLQNTTNNNIKIENTGSYYCNNYSSPLQNNPGIAAVTDRTPPSMIVPGGYSKGLINFLMNFSLIVNLSFL
jgi:hypothetical protein